MYEVHAERTQVAVRVVEAECERDAEEAFADEMTKGGSFFQSVQAELDAMDPAPIEVECVGPADEAMARDFGTLSDDSARERLAACRRIAADGVQEMRWGNIVARRWGQAAPHEFQGLKIGFYAKDGGFVTLAIVEEDRMNMRQATECDPFGDAAFPMKWEYEARYKTLAFATDGAGDAEATVEFRLDEDEGLPTWADFLDAACGNAEYAELLAERCGVGGAFEGSWPSSVVEQDLNEGEAEFVDGKLVLTGGCD